MNRRGTDIKSAVVLQPHQQALVGAMLEPSDSPVVLVEREAGLGATVALMAGVKQQLLNWPTTSVLILVPAPALRSELTLRLQAVQTPALGIDRFRFRELLDGGSDVGLWPQGVACVLTFDFARQPDVLERLAHHDWALMIVDEAHRLTGCRAEAVGRIMRSARRSVIVTLPGGKTGDLVPPNVSRVFAWTRADLAGLGEHAGRLLPVHFGESRDERALAETVAELVASLSQDAEEQRLRARSVRSRHESSPVALEATLQRIAGGLGEPPSGLREDESETPASGIVGRTAYQAVPDHQRRLAHLAIEQIETLGADTKLARLDGWFAEVPEAGRRRRICVVTMYTDTLYYLSADLEGQGIVHQLLHGGMSAEDRDRSLSVCRTRGDVLVATVAPLTGLVSLASATDLVLYDVPRNRNTQKAVLDRALALDRTSPITVHALVPEQDGDGSWADRMASLRRVVRRSVM